MEVPKIMDKVCYFKEENVTFLVKDNRVFVGDKELSLIGYGVDGLVYRYEKYAVKFYHNGLTFKRHLDRESIEKLISFQFKHFIMPKYLLENSEYNPGYVMEYIDLDQEKDILLVEKEMLLKELKDFEEELNYSEENGFLITDFNSKNYFYNGTFYQFDSDGGRFVKKSEGHLSQLYHAFGFIKGVLLDQQKNHLTDQEKKSLFRKCMYQYKKGEYSTLSQYLENEMVGENLQEYYKVLSKK